MNLGPGKTSLEVESNPTMIAAARLKGMRLKYGFTFRQVERLSRVLAERYGDDRYIVRISVLAGIENRGVLPDIFHLHSLCVVYSVGMRTVLSWYGIPDEPSRRTVSR